MNALGHILDITIRQTAHADSSVAEQIYVLLSKQEFTLRGRKTGEAKHVNLFGNVQVMWFHLPGVPNSSYLWRRTARALLMIRSAIVWHGKVALLLE